MWILGNGSNYTLFPQGVEFFDEKLNTLCMAWLIDHGKSPLWISVFEVVIYDMNKWNSLQYLFQGTEQYFIICKIVDCYIK